MEREPIFLDNNLEDKKGVKHDVDDKWAGNWFRGEKHPNKNRPDDRFNKFFRNELDREIDLKDKIQKRGFFDKEDILDIRKKLDIKDALQKANIEDKKNPLNEKEFKKFLIEINPAQVEIVHGTLEAFSKFMDSEPQLDSEDNYRWLLTSGVAVEIITGTKRHHHDTDLVLFDLKDGWWLKYLTDNVTPRKYWADMKFDPKFLEQTAWIARFNANGSEHTVATVHPAIILVQKLSNAWGREPRDRDYFDVDSLIKFWQESEGGDPSWYPIIEKAVAALPRSEQSRTRKRLAPYNIPGTTKNHQPFKQNTGIIN